mmetsp:Transcript_6653/g.10270  ORF Transcript_6653/g.10270 Transcript_6653/m.10270 type:complete len:496 (+) Transcript_6653:1111-2598(+)
MLKIIKQFSLKMIIYNTFNTIVPLIERLFGPNSLLKIVHNNDSSYLFTELILTKSIVSLIEYCKSYNPIIVLLKVQIVKINSIFGDGTIRLSFLLSEFIKHSILLLLKGVRKGTIIKTFINFIKNLLEIIHLNKVKVGCHSDSFLFNFFKVLYNTKIKKIYQKIFFFQIFYVLKKILLFVNNEIELNFKILTLKSLGTIKGFVFNGFVLSCDLRNNFLPKYLGNCLAFFDCSHVNINILYPNLLNYRTLLLKNHHSNTVPIVVLTSKEFNSINLFNLVKNNIYIIQKLNLKEIQSLKKIWKIKNYNNIKNNDTHELTIVDSFFEYEIFGKKLYLFESFNNYRILSFIIMGNNEWEKKFLKSSLKKIIKSFILLIKSKTYIFGAGFIELLTYKYFHKYYNNRENNNYELLRYFLFSILRIPISLLKSTTNNSLIAMYLIKYMKKHYEIYLPNIHLKLLTNIKYNKIYDSYILNLYIYLVSIYTFINIISLDMLIIN